MKKAMIKVYEDERLQELGAKLLMTIHDEMIMECPKENIKEIVEYVEADMKKVGEDLLDMPMKVDTEITNYWYGDDLSEEVL
jgi:DNA polymerase-1